MRFAALVYASFLLVGALGCLAWTVYEQIPTRIGVSVVLFLCAVFFFREVRQPQLPFDPSAPQTVPWTQPGRKPVWLPRSWGFFIFHGIGTGLAIYAWLLEGVDGYLQDLGTFHGRLFLLVFGFHLIVVGLVFILVDALSPGTGRRPQ